MFGERKTLQFELLRWHEKQGKRTFLDDISKKRNVCGINTLSESFLKGHKCQLSGMMSAFKRWNTGIVFLLRHSASVSQ